MFYQAKLFSILVLIGIAWHIDDEKSLGNNPVIASLIFGAEKKIFI
jgi:alkylated DNA repair dioxygenase AlkB